MSDKELTGKISHIFTGEGFERLPGGVTGIHKDRERVTKVSKIL